jgi:hypothetical protein
MLYSANDFPYDDGYTLLRECSLSFHQVKEVSVRPQLDKKIDIVPIIKKVIEFDYIGVVQEPLQLDLAGYLPDDALSFVEGVLKDD